MIMCNNNWNCFFNLGQIQNPNFSNIHQECNDQKYFNIIFTDLFFIILDKEIVTNKHLNVGKMNSQLMLKKIS